MNHLLSSNFLEKYFGDLQRYLQVKTLEQPVHKVQQVHALRRSVEWLRVMLPQHHLEFLKVVTGQLPKCVTNSLIPKEGHKSLLLFSTRQFYWIPLKLIETKGEHKLTFKVNATVREGCLITVGSLINSGLADGPETASSLLLTLVRPQWRDLSFFFYHQSM